ncbi:MAG: hypothetical protein ACRC5M_00145 [Anaeroplasmataceae bacterium]
MMLGLNQGTITFMVVVAVMGIFFILGAIAKYKKDVKRMAANEEAESRRNRQKKDTE